MFWWNKHQPGEEGHEKGDPTPSIGERSLRRWNINRWSDFMRVKEKFKQNKERLALNVCSEATMQ